MRCICQYICRYICRCICRYTSKYIWPGPKAWGPEELSRVWPPVCHGNLVINEYQAHLWMRHQLAGTIPKGETQTKCFHDCGVLRPSARRPPSVCPPSAVHPPTVRRLAARRAPLLRLPSAVHFPPSACCPPSVRHPPACPSAVRRTARLNLVPCCPRPHLH